MSKIVAGITTSVDGYITGPDDGPDRGLGVGGERLHYWVFGGPWSYAPRGQAVPVRHVHPLPREALTGPGQISGLTVRSRGKRPKSRSAVHSACTP